MSKAFSVYVNIGGKLSPSLGAAVSGAKAQVKGLEATLAGMAAKINAPFIAAQKHIAATSKRMAAMQRTGRNLALGVTAPAGYGAVSMIRTATERDKAGNNLEALGGVSHEERRQVEDYADAIASKYGNATGILRTFNEMLKAGFNVAAAKGSIASILEGSIIADGEMSGADLAGAVSKIVTQYGLSMKTVEDASASSRRIVDNLIFGANSTAATVKDMTESYKFVGAAASAAGESIESTNALIIALSKAGQMGSEAGVALRSAYVRVLKPTKEGQATMARLGLDYGDYVSGGKRTGTGVSAGLASFGFDVPAAEIEKALARNKGSNEKQRKAVFDAVVSRLGADQAMDRDAIMKAVDGALTLAGGRTDLTKLLIDLKKKGATQGDLARIFEGRQSVRMLSLLKADLEGILKDVNEGATGYSEKTVAKRQQGLEGATRRLDSAWQTFSNTLVRAVTPEIVGMMERLAGAVKNLAATSPATLKLGVGLVAATAAAGPLAFALGAVGRVGMLALTGLLAPLIWIASGITALGVAMGGLAAAGIARLGVMAVGLRMLTALGAGATLSALGGSFLALGRAVLLFPLTALRGIGLAMWALVANPVGLIITALVAALVALGVWVSNNWSGIKQFFESFGKVFSSYLGPEASGAIKGLVDGLQSAYKWLSDLLGPIDATGEKWATWGGTLGHAVADGVNAVVSGIQRLIGFMGAVIDKAGQVGSAIAGMFSFGGGGAKPAVPAGPLAGARALGGPVTYGKPYLVGERGPELFVPRQTGRVETNNTLRRLTADGAAAVGGSTSTSSTRTYTLNPTINIMGGDDPRETAATVRREMERYMRDLEAEQSGLLSD